MTTVLLVEDDMLLARQFVGTLERAGFSTRHACHGGEAISCIDQQLPDVIILDMLLPVSSGLALLHELQSYQDTARLPVVLCTSVAEQIGLDDVRPYGVARIIDKTTMLPADIVAAVKAVL